LSSEPSRVAAIVLAAGASSRLGTPKQLLEFRGESLVRRAVRSALDAGASPVIVVLGARASEIAAALGGLGDVSLVSNARWRDGLASSLAEGMRAAMWLGRRLSGVLITTADQPLVDEAALRRMLTAFADGGRRTDGLVAAEYSGTIGVPAVIGRDYFDTLTWLQGDAGAGRWLRERIRDVRRIAIPEAAVDIDTAEDSVMLAGYA
jgi:molybdenum cofactor cytidylyltransferase